MIHPQLSLNTMTVGAYLQSVYALTPKDTSDVVTQQVAGQTGTLMPSVPSWTIYAPYLIFFFLFFTTFGLLMFNRLWNMKRIASTMIVALLLAGIPFVLSMLKYTIGTQSYAGPNEIPKNVRIQKKAYDSLQIEWVTDVKQIGAVRYRHQKAPPLEYHIVIEGKGSQVLHHAVIINGLPIGDYDIEIFSGTRWYDNGGVPLHVSLSSP